MPTGKLNKHIINSKLLKNNILGNKSRRELYVYTPPEFSNKEKLPCIFFLPGFGSSPEKQEQKDFPFFKLIELLILNQSIPRTVFCYIDGMSLLGGSQYLDSKLNGPYMSHIVKEITPYVLKKYNTQNEIFICGHSSGGFGALQIASLFPEIFTKTASFAGDMYFELTHKNMLCEMFKNFNDGKYGQSLQEALRSKLIDYTLGLAAAYSPNLRNKRWKMDFPINFKTGEINQNIWEVWNKQDPVEWVGNRKKNLKKLKLIYLSAGDEDQFSLQLGAQVFKERCKKYGINSNTEYHNGNHSLMLRQTEAGLKALLNEK